MKIYLTDKLDYQFDINNILGFEGYVFECEMLDVINHEIQVGHNTVHNGFTFRYFFNFNQKDYIYFRDKLKFVMMCWIVSYDFIYINEDLKTGFKCFVDFDFNNKCLIAKLRMMNYPFRIEKPIQI